MTTAVTGVTSTLSKLNPFGKSKDHDEDKGEAIEYDSVGGGGHAARKSKITKDQLKVSRALRSVLAHEKVLSELDAGVDSERPSAALRELLDQPHIRVPAYVTDRSRPLAEYYISSSHNTYLTAHQLYGTAAPVAYQIALHTGSRCVEIDAWDDDDNKNEPKVTHGYTLASNVPFRAVCEAMRDVVDKEAADADAETEYRAAPIMLSLENHCSAHGQLRLVEIMKEVWGHRLLTKHVRDEGANQRQDAQDQVTLEELGSKIAVIVEYFFPDQKDDSSDSSDDEEDEEDEDEAEKQDRKKYKEQKKKAPKENIIPELAELGVFAQSVKPRDQSWLEGELKGGPHDHLINVSESGLGGLMPKMSEQISKHNAKHLMRVYPKGTRISSRNLNPVPFWGVGAQICALNWQTFDASLQLNEALFAGTDGWALKPAALRAEGSGNLGNGKKKRLRLKIAGATDVPIPQDREASEIRPYVTCTLLHPNDLEDEPPKRKTSAYKQHKLGIIHRGANPPPKNPIFDETLEWEYDDNELTFLRILIKSDDRFASNPIFAVASVRLLYVVEGWSFIRMLDLKGRETHCTLLVKFEIEDA
ncbi:hypothetical protein LTR37_011517 [Vermiconidia calcicola]|uniref:Uncharacterized protein n=1 Tax=Vermiconidia calcicola TaxID=1690605 RepID=A0ACC3N1X2_9PEZI|nr:hypothetical protein LTR37_011517 [Vermiconidia calcicola]